MALNVCPTTRDGVKPVNEQQQLSSLRDYLKVVRRQRVLIVVVTVIFGAVAVYGAAVVVFAITFVTLNLLVDLVYARLDPRIRLT